MTKFDVSLDGAAGAQDGTVKLKGCVKVVVVNRTAAAAESADADALPEARAVGLAPVALHPLRRATEIAPTFAIEFAIVLMYRSPPVPDLAPGGPEFEPRIERHGGLLRAVPAHRPDVAHRGVGVVAIVMVHVDDLLTVG